MELLHTPHSRSSTPAAELKLIPKKVDFGDFVDTRFNGNLPPSTTPAKD
ncbi:hypothetical protein ACWC0C_17165 [Streptomyces sp. NPDC001709]